VALRGWGTAEWTTVAGVRIHAAVAGPMAATTVVCVHGLGCSHRYFAPLAAELCAEARVVAVDLPGFGRSPGPGPVLSVRGLSEALAAWLRATGRGGAVLLGNSSGCQVIVDLAAHSPDLLGPALLQGPTFDPAARTLRQQVPRLLAGRRWERSGLGPVLARDWLACGPRRYFGTLRHLLHDPVEEKLGHLTSRVVVARGTRDAVVPHAWAAQVAAGVPNGELAEVPDAGHTLNWSAPGPLAGLVRPLLADARA